jgi:hypothetical protein
MVQMFTHTAPFLTKVLPSSAHEGAGARIQPQGLYEFVLSSLFYKKMLLCLAFIMLIAVSAHQRLPHIPIGVFPMFSTYLLNLLPSMYPKLYTKSTNKYKNIINYQRSL